MCISCTNAKRRYRDIKFFNNTKEICLSVRALDLTWSSLIQEICARKRWKESTSRVCLSHERKPKQNIYINHFLCPSVPICGSFINNMIPGHIYIVFPNNIYNKINNQFSDLSPFISVSSSSWSAAWSHRFQYSGNTNLSPVIRFTFSWKHNASRRENAWSLPCRVNKRRFLLISYTTACQRRLQSVLWIKLLHYPIIIQPHKSSNTLIIPVDKSLCHRRAHNWN